MSKIINTKELGHIGENAAANFLMLSGYQIIDKNWVCGKYEIDIVCQKNNDIVFVEVKSHHRNSLFNVKNVVGKDKRRKIIYSADKYVRLKNIELNARFDIIEVVFSSENVSEIIHLEDAFYVNRSLF